MSREYEEIERDLQQIADSKYQSWLSNTQRLQESLSDALSELKLCWSHLCSNWSMEFMTQQELYDIHGCDETQLPEFVEYLTNISDAVVDDILGDRIERMKCFSVLIGVITEKAACEATEEYARILERGQQDGRE